MEEEWVVEDVQKATHVLIAWAVQHHQTKREEEKKKAPTLIAVVEEAKECRLATLS